MALWRAFRQTSGNVALLYVNTVTRRSERLGTTRPDVPLEMIVDWIVETGEPGAHDVIILPDGRVLQLVLGGDA